MRGVILGRFRLFHNPLAPFQDVVSLLTARSNIRLLTLTRFSFSSSILLSRFQMIRVEPCSPEHTSHDEPVKVSFSSTKKQRYFTANFTTTHLSPTGLPFPSFCTYLPPHKLLFELHHQTVSTSPALASTLFLYPCPNPLTPSFLALLNILPIASKPLSRSASGGPNEILIKWWHGELNRLRRWEGLMSKKIPGITIVCSLRSSSKKV